MTIVQLIVRPHCVRWFINSVPLMSSCSLYLSIIDCEKYRFSFNVVCNKWDLNLSRFRVLERLGARALSTHIRVFADFLVYEFSISVGGKHLNKVKIDDEVLAICFVCYMF